VGLLTGTFACELASGDRILSGQSFEVVSHRALAADWTDGRLMADVIVERVEPDPMEPVTHVEITLRSNTFRLRARRGRVVRTA
jgi:hypothetical protein